MATEEYVLGTHPEELQRLGLQAHVWRAETLALWERAGFGWGQRLLDVACGPGFATVDLARVAGPSGSVLAIDQSQPYLDYLQSQSQPALAAPVETRQMDVEQLDLEPDSFDGAWVRWVLCFLRQPANVLRGLARALKPGGKLVIFDYAHYEAMTLWPEANALRRVVQAVSASFRDRGGDPNVGRRLPHLCAEVGLKIEEVRPVLRLVTPDSELWTWPDSFFKGYVPTLQEKGYLSAAEERAFYEEWERAAADPLTRFYTPVIVEIIASKL